MKHVLRRVYINKHREEQRKPKLKAKRDPRPDNKRKAINGAMALAFHEAGLV